MDSIGRPNAPQPRSAYVHVPFCRHRCGYCNFTVVADRDDLIDHYLDAISREAHQTLANLRDPGTNPDGARENAAEPWPVQTVFLGGGTPTHLATQQLDRLLSQVNSWFRLVPSDSSEAARWSGSAPNESSALDPRCEFSVEANPSDLKRSTVRQLADAGVTRMSLGAQSFHEGKLQLLERDHGAGTIEKVVEWCLEAFQSTSLDLIFGCPGETRNEWNRDLDRAIRLSPQHISTYGLTFEKGTAFWGRLRRGELVEQAEEDARWMYETAIDRLTEAGYEHYEVSNFAKPDHRCRHNETYWTGHRYFGIGPGAASYLGRHRATNHRSSTTYLRRMRAGQDAVMDREHVDDQQELVERIIFGLRRLEGVDLSAIEQSVNSAVPLPLEKKLGELADLGLVDQVDRRVRLTRAGLLVSDAIWPQLL